MGYYDSVKDNVKETGGASKPNFDTLRKAAEETSEPAEEKEGDDTDIEILEEGLGKRSGSSSSSGMKELESGDKTESKTRDKSTSGSQKAVSADMSNVEKKLDKIIEQNERMIDILESFGS